MVGGNVHIPVITINIIIIIIIIIIITTHTPPN